jgi:hypothetical protein
MGRATKTSFHDTFQKPPISQNMIWCRLRPAVYMRKERSAERSVERATPESRSVSTGILLPLRAMK